VAKSKSPRVRKQDLITASEIARYIYCHRAWWYDRQARTRQQTAAVYSITHYALGLTALVMLAGFMYLAWQRRKLPPDEVFYEGHRARRFQRQWTAWEYGITGHIDYVVEHKGYLIPILRKSGKAPQSPSIPPYDSHLAQLVALCLLIQENKKLIPPYGIIRYDDRTFEVDYDEAAFTALLDTLDEIQSKRHANRIPQRSHDEPRRCIACRHRKTCDVVLSK
jgi:CRISPR-associated exonuclease Cas4